VPAALLVSACLAVLVVLGVAERLVAWRCRRAVPVRIHVNGTRGKSTVTRLIAAALRDAGIPTLAKVTGTLPRLIMPDGSEHPVVRRGPANIREQLHTLRWARRHGARALVIECMAVRPDLQWTSEQDMVRATIGVVTNVRIDHREVMGHTLDDIARTLANTVPAAAVVVVGATPLIGIFENQARVMGTRVIVARAPATPGDSDPAWVRENREVALAVTRQLAIPDDVALAGMARAALDAGAASLRTVEADGRLVLRLDAGAANDPQSLDEIVAASPVAAVAPDRRLVVYNHRNDRPERFADFLDHSLSLSRAGDVIITGDRPAWTLSRRFRHRQRRPLRFVPRERLEDVVRAAGTFEAVLVCGNTRGLVVEPPARSNRG
jgi:gamma-polyglutamate synthase